MGERSFAEQHSYFALTNDNTPSVRSSDINQVLLFKSNLLIMNNCDCRTKLNNFFA